MKISTETASIAKLVGEQKGVELIAKAGFDAFDFSICDAFPYHWGERKIISTTSPLCSNNALAYCRKLKQIAEDNGIVCNQSHAPFPVCDKEVYSTIPFALECTAEAGGKICIVHPDNDKTAEENAEMYFELLPIAKSFGVKIATENMWNWDHSVDHARPAACSDAKSFLEHLNAVNDEYLVACLDIGHAEMKGLDTNSVDMINALGDKLQALHIHDNDMWHDTHQIPYSMQIDFDKIAKALKGINYSGYFTLEAISYLNAFTPDTAMQGLKDLLESAKKLVKTYEKA